MNIDLIKEDIKKYYGKKVTVKEYLGRNKYEEYHGTVKEMYPNTFIIEVDGIIKSFTYSDIVIKNIIIKQ